MIDEVLIRRGGSKLEFTRAIIEQGLEKDLPVPVSAWRYYGEMLDPLLRAFQRMKKPVIVRGSHQNDYRGFIDVVPTVKNVGSAAGVEQAVRRIEDEMKSDAVRIHCADWDQPYSPEVHMLLQEQVADYAATMIRHPHMDRIILQYEYQDGWTVRRGDFLVRKEIKSLLPSADHSREAHADLRAAAELMVRFEATDLGDSAWAYQLEATIRPLMFLQARPFKKRQQAPRISQNIDYAKPHISSVSGVFGITGQEGIPFPFVILNAKDLAAQYMLPAEPYGLIVVNKDDLQDIPLITSVRTGHMAAFCSPVSGQSYLFHNNYRFMKKADYSLAHAMLMQNCKSKDLAEMGKNDKLWEQFRHARVFADGVQSYIVPE